MGNSTDSTKKPIFTDKQIQLLEALEKTGGNRSEACRIVKIDRGTYYNWTKNNADFKRVVNIILEVVDESILDLAINKLKEQVEAGNISAIIHVIKTKGRGRGYSTDYNFLDDEPPYSGTRFINGDEEEDEPDIPDVWENGSQT
jgi:hypothetical protein